VCCNIGFARRAIGSCSSITLTNVRTFPPTLPNKALEKALEARKRERALSKFRDTKGVTDYGGPELTFAAEFQVAAMYAANKLWQEALDGYTALVRSKQLPQGSSLRVNIGNVYFEQGRYPPAIKAYRMALDALPPSAGASRARLLRNIGLAFVRMGQYADAASAYEQALAAQSDHQVRCRLYGQLPSSSLACWTFDHRHTRNTPPTTKLPNRLRTTWCSAVMLWVIWRECALPSNAS